MGGVKYPPWPEDGHMLTHEKIVHIDSPEVRRKYDELLQAAQRAHAFQVAALSQKLSTTELEREKLTASIESLSRQTHPEKVDVIGTNTQSYAPQSHDLRALSHKVGRLTETNQRLSQELIKAREIADKLKAELDSSHSTKPVEALNLEPEIRYIDRPLYVERVSVKVAVLLSSASAGVGMLIMHALHHMHYIM